MTRFSDVSISIRKWAFRAHRDMEIRDHQLLYLFLELTRRCNLSCAHCGSDCTSAPADKELDGPSWCVVIDYMVERYAPFFVITGGEPLMSPELMLVTTRLAERHASWGMVTNGFILDEGRFRALAERGMSSMTISIDGLKESHNALRRHPEAFDRAMRAIGILGSSSLEYRDAVTCVRGGMLHELDELGERLLALGLNSWRLFRIFPKGRAARNPDLRLHLEDTERLLSWIATRRPHFRRKGLSISYSCEGYLDFEKDRSVRDELFFCRSGINIASILSDGTITGCNNNGPLFYQGNIATDDFAETWERGFLSLRDRSWMRNGLCSSCAEWKDCLGSSLHLRNLEQEGPAFCYMRKD